MPATTRPVPVRAVARARLFAVAAAALTGACVPIATQRLPQDVGAAIAQHKMRRYETDDMRVYYPEGREIEAWRFLTRVEGCVDHLRNASQLHNGVTREKI